MKSYFIFIISFAIGLIACQKNKDLVNPSFTSLSQSSGKSSGGGGSTTGFIQSVLSGTASRLIGGTADSILVTFTQPAPAGWTLTLTSSDPSVQVPAAFAVPQGAFGVYVTVTSSVVPAAKTVTINVSLGSQTKSTVLKVFPLDPVFPAPVLQSPSNGASFKSRIQVKFTWSANANAYYHDIQISDNTAFTNPMLEVYLNDPIWAASYFNGTGVRYWRVRYVAAGGNFGPWSAVRSFTVKPQ